MLNYENKSVEELRISFKSAINQGIVKFVPIQKDLELRGASLGSPEK